MNMTITESDKKLLSFLAAFLLAVLFMYFVLRPLNERNEELKSEITVTKDQEIAMDMSASLAEDMAVREKSTQEKMAQTMQRFYPMLESQEAENMITVLMLNHDLEIQELSIIMPEVPSSLKWYQYSENAAIPVAVESSNGLEEEKEEPVDEFGIYTARITCTVDGSSKDIMALVDDISLNYPAISIMAAEWSVMEKPVSVQQTVTQETDEEADGEEVRKMVTTTKTETTAAMTISLEIYMCEQ